MQFILAYGGGGIILFWIVMWMWWCEDWAGVACMCYYKGYFGSFCFLSFVFVFWWETVLCFKFRMVVVVCCWHVFFFGGGDLFMSVFRFMWCFD